MATSPESVKRLPSQENLLLDYIHRLEKHKGGRKVVHVHLSKLRAFNRREQHIRTAASNFEGMVKTMQGQLFSLKSSDLFFVYKDEARPQVETAVRKVRFLFNDDPLVDGEQGNGAEFATWYDAEKEFDEILHLVQRLVNVEQKREKETLGRRDTRALLKAKQKEGEPITPEILGRVETALARTDLSNLVRRQYICNVDKNMVPEQFFSEMFISINDLRETLLPGVNLASNRWLFQHLTQTLDRRMLAMLIKTDNASISGDISFNLNVSTLLSDEFQTFDGNVSAGRRGAMIIELQNLDIFADLSSYLFAREFVQDKGYRVCLDGMTHQTLAMIDRERLGADFVKLVWHSDMIDRGEAMHEQIRDLVRRTGGNRVILSRVDNREAVDFGQSVGISYYQGRFVENLIAEDIRRRELLRLKRRMERSASEEEEEME